MSTTTSIQNVTEPKISITQKQFAEMQRLSNQYTKQKGFIKEPFKLFK